MATEHPSSDRGRNAAIGCLMLPVGAACGAMIAVLLSKIVALALHVPACTEGMTVPCFWYKFAGVGALLGALSLPTLVLRRLLQRPPADPSHQG